MAKGNKKSLFWTSYSDLMTCLFFTLLVLFVVAIIAHRDPLLANAVSKMAVYVQDRFPAAFPSKEQTEAVNSYLDSICKPKHEPMTEIECEHRRLASHKITIAAICVLDRSEQERLQDVLDHISYDREYYLPERTNRRYF